MQVSKSARSLLKGLLLLAGLAATLKALRRRSNRPTAKPVSGHHLNAPSQRTSHDRLAILLSVYDVERQDQEQAALVAMALITIGSAFLGGSLLFLNADCSIATGCQSIPRWALLIFPVFPLALLGQLVQNLAAVLARDNYILRIEREIAALTQAQRGTLEIPYYGHLSRFVWGEGGLKNAHYKFASIFVYSSLLLIAIGFCLVILHLVGWHWYSYLAASLYGLVLLIETFIVLASSSARRLRFLETQATLKFWGHAGMPQD
jgi:hypothetical protein